MRSLLTVRSLLIALFLVTATSLAADSWSLRTLAGAASGGGYVDATGAEARFSLPCSLAVDSSGNVFVTDRGNRVIRRVTPAGEVTTFAGLAGSSGSSDGSGSDARFHVPWGIAIDPATRSLILADEWNHTIRSITPGGAVTTLAGRAGYSGSTDGSGSSARFYFPQGVAVDRSGNVWVADTDNHVIRRISAGVVATLAGLAGTSGSADGSGSAARFRNPAAITIDSNGDAFVADTGNQTIRKVTHDGVVTTIAGSPSQSGSADGSGSAARFFDPFGITTSPSGDLWVADANNNKIRRVTTSGLVTTVAGSGTYGIRDGEGSSARFAFPSGIAFDASGNAYVADRDNSAIRKISPTLSVSTIAGSSPASGAVDSTGLAARLTYPSQSVVDTAGNIYFGDETDTIRRIAPDGGVTTFAGVAGARGSTDGTRTTARFNNPNGLAIDAYGNLWVADTNNHTIRRISSDGTVTTVAGAAGSSGNTDGNGSTARFSSPWHLAFDGSGNLLIADTGNHLIRSLSPGRTVARFAGSGARGSHDGAALSATFNSPTGIAVDSGGAVYVADFGNNVVRKISGGNVTTLAGDAAYWGFRDATGSAARFHGPYAVALDRDGNVIVADGLNDTIRRVTPAGAVTTILGLAFAAGNVDGIGGAARLNTPEAVTVDAQNRIIVSDAHNHTIRVATNTTPVSTTIAYFTATPAGFLSSGGPVTLSWSTIDASMITIAPGVGGVAASGYALVNPQQTTTYTLTATGPTGTAVARTTVWFGDRRRAVGETPQSSDSQRASVRASAGGTVTLGRARVTIAPGVLRDDRDVVLTQYVQPLRQPPSGNLTVVGPALCVTFSAPAAGTSPAAGGSGSGISMTLDLSTASSSQLEGAAPFAQIKVPTLPSDSRDLLLGMPGSVDAAAKTATVTFSRALLDSLYATEPGTTATLCAEVVNWSPALRATASAPPPMESTAMPELLRYDGQNWVPAGFDTPFTGRTCVMVHGVLSKVDNAFPSGECMQKIKEANGCDQVLGFNYTWYQSAETSGSQLADALRGRTLGTVLIEGHSLGGLVAMNAIPKMTGINVEQLVTLGSPIDGSPMANSVETLATFLAYWTDAARGRYDLPLLQFLYSMGLKGQLLTGGPFVRNTQAAFVGTTVKWTAAAGTTCPMPQWICEWIFGSARSDGIVSEDAALGTVMSSLPSSRVTRLSESLIHTDLQCKKSVIDAVGSSVYQAPVLNAVLVVSPSQLTFSTTEGKDPQPDSLRVTNAATATKALDYDIASSATWLKLSGPTSSLPPGQTDLYTVYADAAQMKLTGITQRVENATITAKERNGSQQKSVPVTLTIKPPKYALLVGWTGTGAGTISSNPVGIACPGKCTASFDTDSTVLLTAQEAAGSTFNGWTGVCAGSARTCSVTMSSDKSASAIFNSQSQPSLIAGSWSGDWRITAASKSWCIGGYGSWKAEIQENGGRLTGSWQSGDCSGQLTGTIQGVDVTWNGEGCGVTFHGTVTDTRITGTFTGKDEDCGDVSGEFSGTKK